MKQHDSASRKVFLTFNNIFMFLVAASCLAPLIHVLAVSLSSSAAAQAGWVTFWPVEGTLQSYQFVLGRDAFWLSIVTTFRRVGVGTPLNLLLTVLVAYPLSKERYKFGARTFYAWFFFFTMLFSGGLIPSFILVHGLGLMDTVWSLVLPGAVPIFSVILMLNFFRQIPIELEEAALIDGAGHWRTLFSIYIPCSLPAIATIALFSMVGHWNSWFDGMIFSNFPRYYPLQTYLRSVIVMRDVSAMGIDDWRALALVSDRTVRAAQVFIGALPMLAVYPFLQRYFIKGIVVGSVKG